MAEAAGFARVDAGGAAAGIHGGVIEVRLRGASICIEPGAELGMVTAILMALRATR